MNNDMNLISLPIKIGGIPLTHDGYGKILYRRMKMEADGPLAQIGRFIRSISIEN